MPFSDALSLATETHKTSTWKKTDRPFLYHPLAVASLVLRFGGTGEQAMAAILHDCIESVPELEMARRFGPVVARLAFSFADPAPTPNSDPSWAGLKKAYLAKVESLPDDALLLILCEELHELQELVWDVRTEGMAAYQRYPVPDRDLVWYFRKLLAIGYQRFPKGPIAPLVQEMARLVKGIVLSVHEGAAL